MTADRQLGRFLSWLRRVPRRWAKRAERGAPAWSPERVRRAASSRRGGVPPQSRRADTRAAPPTTVPQHVDLYVCIPVLSFTTALGWLTSTYCGPTDGHGRGGRAKAPFQLSPEIHSFFPPPPPRPPARQGRKQSGQQLFVQCNSTSRGCRREGGGGRGRRVLPPALDGRDASNGRHPRGPFRVRPPGDSPPDFDPRFTRCHAAAGGGGAATLRQGRGSGTRRCP